MNVKPALLTFLVFLSCHGIAQPFLVRDVLISSPNARISDTEFDPYKKRMCWQSLDDHKLWVCYLDTMNWSLAVPDGKQFLVDSSLVPLDQTFNAGEWGFDQTGSYLVYNKLVNRHKYIAVAKETGYNWTLDILWDAMMRLNPHATRNPADSLMAFHYISAINDNATKYKTIDHPCWENSIHGFTDAHWANEEQLLTGIMPNEQVGLFNPDSPGYPVQLTFDYGTLYSRPYLWRSPDGTNAHLLFTVANGTEVRVFKEARKHSDTYNPYMSFISPSSNPLLDKIASPELIVYNGESYISFLAAKTPYESETGLAEVWIAKVDSLDPFFRMVSDTLPRYRTDPEPFPTNETLYIYYTEVVDSLLPDTAYRVRKCETGITNGTYTGIHATNNPACSLMSPFPNPFTSRLAVENALGSEQFTLFNPLGQIVWKGTELAENDFSFLTPGLYFLNARLKNTSQTFKILKE